MNSATRRNPLRTWFTLPCLVSAMMSSGTTMLCADESESHPGKLMLRPLPPAAVRLTGGPLKHSQDLNASYLLALEPDRMLAGYRMRAGLEPRAEGYGGWDSVNGKQLTGHIAGHYLSAVSLMFAATGDERFKQRADYLVSEFKLVQDAHGDGYLGAIEGGREKFAEVAAGDIRSGGFDLNGLWAPWYVLHKTFAGLRDAYRYTGNATALDLEKRFATWAEAVLSGLDDAQVRRMLNTEFGGMNEVLCDLYADTGDARWLALARRFEHVDVTTPLKRHHDCLSGLHGNTQVPKLLGSLSLYRHAGRLEDGVAASFFWSRVVDHHSFSTGGHGKDEYFGDPDKMNDRVDGRTAESCNVYNMLKLTRGLFSLHGDARYADFHERALFNHVLASQDPQEGWACYMVPVGRGVQREYERDMLNGGFTCCTGSSMESHALHSGGIYHEDGSGLWVGLYTPSTAIWKERGVTLETQTDFPQGELVTMRLSLRGPESFALMLRRPHWARDFAVRINDAAWQLEEPAFAGRSDFVKISREWHDGDVVEVRLPKSLRIEPLPDNPNRVSILWGPLVLAADLGPEDSPAIRGNSAGHIEGMPVFIGAGRPPEEWLEPIKDRPGCFRSVGVGRDRDVEFLPFHQLHRRTYAVYLDLYTPEGYAALADEIAAAEARAKALADATVAFVQPGEMQPERDFNMQGENTSPVRIQGRAGRRAAGWFSFDLPVEPGTEMDLVVTYNHDEWSERKFSILVDGNELARESLPRRGPLKFYDRRYPLPPAGGDGKAMMTLQFRAEPGSETAAVYAIRVIRRGANGVDPD